MGYTVIDNFLSTEEFTKIQNYFYNSTVLPWYYADYTIKNKADNEPDHPQLMHVLLSPKTGEPIWSHSGSNVIMELLKKINPHTLIRIKLNMQFPQKTQERNAFHQDMPTLVKENTEYTTGIYYLNTCDGYTIFEDGTKINTVENRLLLLSGDTMHTGCAPTIGRRVVMNINFINDYTSNLYKKINC
jgi:hypothetical protein